MLIGVGMNILPFLFIYQIITPLIMHQQISTHYIILELLPLQFHLSYMPFFMLKVLPYHTKVHITH